MQHPPNFSAIRWSEPVTIEDLRVDRVRLPSGPGIYLFTNHPGPVEPFFGILYVGKADSLRLRVPAYLANPENVPIFSTKRPGQTSSSLRHAGKVQLLVEVQQKMRSGVPGGGVWVRWHECAAPRDLEKMLIRYLQPAFNSQDR